jgi:methylthioribose-1-phosphate isomerase
VNEIKLPFKTIEWKNGKLTLIDQRLLPGRVQYVDYGNYRDVIVAVKNLTVRGAPAIGVAAAYAMVLASAELIMTGNADYMAKMEAASREIGAARPTAVNLRWAVDRIRKIIGDNSASTPRKIHELIEAEAIEIETEDKQLCLAMGSHGAELIDGNDGIMTHCNAGALATAGIGTALGVIYTAAFSDKKIKVYSTETRPLDQGRRLTTWELAASGLDVTLLCDNMAASLMSSGAIDKVIVGADRIAANGDTANKIGTYNIAIIADRFGIPFYVAAPYSTIDLNTADGTEIPIEFRDTNEIADVTGYAGIRGNISIYAPAFDVTPNSLITGYITDKGVIKSADIKELFAA